MKKYSVIYADPPWSYNDKLGTGRAKMGGYSSYYKGMSLTDICSLPVSDISANDSILFLWATMPLLPEAFKVIKAWGFKYKTVAFTWVKQNPKSKTIFKGVGRWVMGNAELCLLATKGKPRRIIKSISQIILSPRGKHSQKPIEARERIVRLMGDVPRIELFARKPSELLDTHSFGGWDVWGNEVESDISL